MLLYLSEEERILVVDGVEAVCRDQTRPEFFPDGVGRQTVHVHFNVRAHFLVRQELAGNDLRKPKYFGWFSTRSEINKSAALACTEH